MKKKVIMFLGMLMLSVPICACSMGNASFWEKENIESETVLEENIEQEIVLNENLHKEYSTSDLLYRKQEFNIGFMRSAGVVTIYKELIVQNIANAEKVIVIYNDELFEEIPLSENFIEIEFDKSGYYGFFVEDQQGEIHDVNYAVHTCVSAENILWLEGKNYEEND